LSAVKVACSLLRGIPGELIGFIAFAVALCAVIVAGHAIAGSATSPWLAAVSYVAPGAAAFAIYWLVTRRR
jgi:hypothetical protein